MSTEGLPPTFPGSPPGPPPKPSAWSRIANSWAAAVLDQLAEPASWLPGLFLIGSISYTAWANWWL